MVLDTRNHDSVQEAAAEEVLLARFDTYYPDIINWFFQFILSGSTPTKILDVGCGTGHLLEVCNRQLQAIGGSAITPSFHGMDLSQYLIANAKRRFPAYEFEAGDATQLPYPDETFDLVYVAAVLAHVPCATDILQEMVRVTKGS